MRDYAISTKVLRRVGSVATLAVLALWGATLSGCGAEPGAELLAGDPPQVQTQQADPGELQVRVYEILDVNSNLLAYVLVPATTGTYNSATYHSGTEYWYSVAHSVASLTSMSVSWTDYNWSGTSPVIPSGLPLGTLSFTMTQGATFSSSSAPPNSSSCFVSTSLNVAINWGSLAYSSSAPHWSGSLTWYDTSGADNVFGSGASSPQTLTASTTDSNSVTWYDATVDPVNPPG